MGPIWMSWTIHHYLWLTYIVWSPQIPTEAVTTTTSDERHKNHTHVPQGLLNAGTIEILLLQSNLISELDNSSFVAYGSLWKIDLSDNPLTAIHDGTFYPLTRLKLVDFTYCQIHTLPVDFGPSTTKIKNLFFSHGITDPSILGGYYFSAFTNLFRLYLSGVDLSGFSDPNALNFPETLKDLYVDNTNLPLFPNLSHTSITRLAFMNNDIKELPAYVLPPPLEVLLLGKCGLTKVSDLSSYSNAREIHLPDNQLTTLSDLLNLSLTKLQLGNNPVNCDQRMCWLRMWERKKPLPSLINGQCASPPEVASQPLMKVNPRLMNCQDGK